MTASADRQSNGISHPRKELLLRVRFWFVFAMP